MFLIYLNIDIYSVLIIAYINNKIFFPNCGEMICSMNRFQAP